VHRILAGRGAAGSDLGDIQRRPAANTDDEIGTAGEFTCGAKMREFGFALKIRIEPRIDARGGKLGRKRCGETARCQKPIHDHGCDRDVLEALGRGCEIAEQAGAEADIWN
jgi:hypothetical protein